MKRFGTLSHGLDPQESRLMEEKREGGSLQLEEMSPLTSSYTRKLLYALTPYLEAVISPRSKLHDTRLFIKRKVSDIDSTRTFVNGRRFPLNHSFGIQNSFRCKSYLEISVGTVSTVRYTRTEKTKRTTWIEKRNETSKYNGSGNQMVTHNLFTHNFRSLHFVSFKQYLENDAFFLTLSGIRVGCIQSIHTVVHVPKFVVFAINKKCN